MPILLATAYIVVTQYGVLATSVGKDSTLSQRTIIWKAVWESIVQRPYLGYGFSAFWSGLNGPSQRVVLISDWGIQQAQNGYLDLWLGLGVGGVVIVALMSAFAIRTFFKRVPIGESSSQLRWCTVIIIVTLLFNIGETTFGLLEMMWFLFLLAYMGLQSLRRKGRLGSTSLRDEVDRDRYPSALPCGFEAVKTTCYEFVWSIADLQGRMLE